MNSLDKALLCVDIIQERKAVEPTLLDVEKLTYITDYFVVASGRSSRQVQAIAGHLQTKMKGKGFAPFGVEGERDGHWILLDYGEVLVHIFYHPVREFYDIEGLWAEAARVEIKGKL